MTRLIKEKVSVICCISRQFFLHFANTVLVDFHRHIRYVCVAKAPNIPEKEAKEMKNRVKNLLLMGAGILAGITLTSATHAATS